MLTKNFNSAGFSTSRATIRCSGSPGRPSAPTGENRRCLTSQTIGPLCPSLTRHLTQGWLRNPSRSSIASTRRGGGLPLARRGVLRPRPRPCLWNVRVTTRGALTQPMKFRGTSPTNFWSRAESSRRRLGLAAVALVEGHPVEVQAVADGAVVELQGDLPLGPVHHVVGDAGLAAAGAVVGPGLRQVQFAVEQAVEAVAGVGEVDRDDAVLLLADGAAPLPLHAGGLVPLLDVAGLVEDPDRVGPGVLVADDLLEVVAHRSSSQWCWLRNSCRVLGGTPALMAIGSTLFSGMSESCPEMYTGRWARVSLRGKQSSNRLRNFFSAGLSLRICGMSMLVPP